MTDVQADLIQGANAPAEEASPSSQDAPNEAAFSQNADTAGGGANADFEDGSTRPGADEGDWALDGDEMDLSEDEGTVDDLSDQRSCGWDSGEAAEAASEQCAWNGGADAQTNAREQNDASPHEEL